MLLNVLLVGFLFSSVFAIGFAIGYFLEEYISNKLEDARNNEN